MRFMHRVASVTGAAAGMGKAAALGFAAEGAAVVINDIDEEGLQATAAAVRSLGSRVALAPGDITDASTIDLMVERATAQFGRIDVLFNYVGGDPDLAPQKPFVEQTDDFWERMIAINLTSTIRACRAVLPTMIGQGYGRIVNTGAVAGKIGGPNMALYSAVKGGVIAFTKALALEMAPARDHGELRLPGSDRDAGPAAGLCRSRRPGRDRDRSARATGNSRGGRQRRAVSRLRRGVVHHRPGAER